MFVGRFELIISLIITPISILFPQTTKLPYDSHVSTYYLIQRKLILKKSRGERERPG